jgi:hypothetical protein
MKKRMDPTSMRLNELQADQLRRNIQASEVNSIRNIAEKIETMREPNEKQAHCKNNHMNINLLGAKRLYTWHKGDAGNRFWMWLAWRLPRRLIYWCAIRLISAATVGKHADTVVPELSAMDALARWDKS